MRGTVQLVERAGGFCVTAVKVRPRSVAAVFSTRSVDGLAVMKITPVPSALCQLRSRNEEHFLAGLQQAVDGDERVVDAVADDVADGAGRFDDASRRAA